MIVFNVNNPKTVVVGRGKVTTEWVVVTLEASIVDVVVDVEFDAICIGVVVVAAIGVVVVVAIGVVVVVVAIGVVTSEGPAASLRIAAADADHPVTSVLFVVGGMMTSVLFVVGGIMSVLFVVGGIISVLFVVGGTDVGLSPGYKW